MAAGQAEIGLPGRAPVLAARTRGVDVVFRACSAWSCGRSRAIRRPADLKGQTIGVGTADGAEVGFTRAILNDLGMVEGEDYEFLPVGDGGPATAAFERGD